MQKLIAAVVLLALAGVAVVATLQYESVADALSRSDGYSSPAEPTNISTAHTADSIPMSGHF
jgi:hypothetical protein